MKVMGLDIGGANIKTADMDGNVRSVPFAMWTRSQQLPEELVRICDSVRPVLVGLTMTAELADCFETKADGVNHVVESVRRAFPEAELRVWLTSGEFAEPDDAVELPQLVAAANWHALATWAGRAVPEGPAILIDAGSTTTDIVPLVDGIPVPHGLTDLERLKSGELIYTGARRTPLCAVRSCVQIKDATLPVAAEVFATTQDIHVVLCNLDEDRDCTETADGRPLTNNACLNRIARMVCCEGTELSRELIHGLASQFADAQTSQITEALRRVSGDLSRQLEEVGRSDAADEPRLILSGSGVFLAEAAADQLRFTRRIDLNELGHSAIAEAACAFAVARLVHERCRGDLLETVLSPDTGKRVTSPRLPL